MSDTFSEIKCQYNSLSDTATYIKNRINVLNQYLAEEPFQTLAFVGNGVGYALCQSFARTYQMASGKHALAFSAGELQFHMEEYTALLNNAVVIALSVSGKDADLLAAVQGMKDCASVRAITISCGENCPLSALADVSFEMPWGANESPSSPGSLSNLYLAGEILALGIAGQTERLAGLEEDLPQLAGILEGAEPEFLALAKKRWDNALILGDGELVGVANAGARLIQQVGSAWALSADVSETKNGVLDMVGKTTLLFINIDKPVTETSAMLADAGRRTPLFLVASDKLISLPRGAYLISQDIADNSLLRGLILLISCQYLAYYRALVYGLSPDSVGSRLRV